MLVVTSDKVYKNIEKSEPYFENDEIFGTDPYSASKSMAEIAINSYIKSFLLKKKILELELLELEMSLAVEIGQKTELF